MGLVEERSRGLAFDKSFDSQAGRKSRISLAQVQAKKDIREGKQTTII
jgi:hypothetical protein